jgi:hypothetical protein
MMTDARTGATERKPMRRMPWGLVLCVLICGAFLASCDGPNRGGNTQISGVSAFSIDTTASPNVVRGATAGSGSSDGGCSQIQVVVHKGGQLVDGTLVTVSVTLGVLKSGTDEFVAITQTTTRGVALFVWCAKAERGTATITATAEDTHDFVLITIF